MASFVNESEDEAEDDSIEDPEGFTSDEEEKEEVIQNDSKGRKIKNVYTRLKKFDRIYEGRKFHSNKPRSEYKR